jgi:hypothetical protein
MKNCPFVKRKLNVLIFSLKHGTDKEIRYSATVANPVTAVIRCFALESFIPFEQKVSL